MAEGMPRPGDAGPTEPERRRHVRRAVPAGVPADRPHRLSGRRRLGGRPRARAGRVRAGGAALGEGAHVGEPRRMGAPGRHPPSAVRTRARDTRRRVLHLGAGPGTDVLPTTSVDVRDALMACPRAARGRRPALPRRPAGRRDRRAARMLERHREDPPRARPPCTGRAPRRGSRR